MRRFLEHRPLAAIAWRDLVANYSRFCFVLAAMALGIAALVGVRGSAQSVRRQFLEDTRALIAADVVVQSPTYPTEAQRDAVARLNAGGLDSTLVAETLTMAASPNAGRPQIVDVTAVDPAKYPFYGTVALQPRMALARVLDANTVAVSPMLLSRLNAQAGSTVSIAGVNFRVGAVLVSQPDRLLNENPVALPVLMSAEGFARTGLRENGGRLSSRYLFKLRQSTDENLDALRQRLGTIFPASQITDYRQGKPELSTAIDQATSGLSMICLFALVLAATGVAMTMRAHVRERLDAIAAMRSLGATFRQVFSIYLLQTLVLGSAGSVAGIVCGFVLEIVLLRFARDFFTGAIAPAWSWQTAAEALVAGLLSTLLLTLPVLMDIRRAKPLGILRRDFEPRSGSRAGRTLMFATPIFLCLGLLAIWLSRSLQITKYFLVATVAAAVGLAIVAQIVLWMVRSFVAATGKLSYAARYGIKSLARPGNQTMAVLIALGISTGFTLGVFLVQRATLQELAEHVPATIPNLILAGVTGSERPQLLQLLARRTELSAPVELVPMTQARLLEIDGHPAETRLAGKDARRMLQSRPAAGVDARPAGAVVTEGAWWGEPARPGQVAVREDLARRLSLKPDSRLLLQLGTKSLPVTVAAIYRWQERSLVSSFSFMVPTQALADIPVLYVGGIRLKPNASANDIQELIYKNFPTLTVFNVSEIVRAFETITNELTLIVKSLAAFVMVAGVGVLAASIGGDRLERSREVVFLKAMGATRRQILVMLWSEFLVLGLLAGTVGVTFANLFAALLAQRLFHFTLGAEWTLNLTALLATACLAILTGWLATYRVLRLRPNEALR